MNLVQFKTGPDSLAISILKHNFSSQLQRKRTYKTTCHQIVAVLTGIFDQVGGGDGALRAALVENIDDIGIQGQILINLIINAAEGFPATVKIDRVRKVINNRKPILKNVRTPDGTGQTDRYFTRFRGILF